MTAARQHPLEQRLIDAWPASTWRDTHAVIAVSGGPDSIGLLRATLAVKQRCGGDGKVFAAHFNHQLRGAAAEDDQAWLADLCRQLEVPLELGRADLAAFASDKVDGREAASRMARYEFLRETAERLGARFVAVAHTADDQVETILHRILRGTGLDGLTGMRASRTLSPSVALVRPLLATSRAAVLEYLHEIGQPFRVDKSNTDLRWTRNRLRHELLPMLRERYNLGVGEALLRLAVQAGEAQHIVADLATLLAHDCVQVEPARSASRPAAASVQIDCHRLSATPPLVVREVCKNAWQQAGWPLQAMGFAEWQQLAEAIHRMHGLPANLPGNVRAHLDGQMLILEVVRPATTCDLG